MPKLDDKTTDRLFQTGAGRHDFAYDPAAWEQMEQLLDHDEANRRRRWAWILLAGLLGLGLAGFWAYTEYGGQDANQVSPLTEQQALPEGPIAYEGELVPAASVPTAPVPDTDGTDYENSAASAASTEPNRRGRKADDARVSPDESPTVNNLNGGIISRNETTTPPSNEAIIPDDANQLSEAAPDNSIGHTVRIPAGYSVVDRISADPAVLIVPQTALPVVSLTETPEGRIEKIGLRPGLALTASAGLTSGMVNVTDPGPADVRLGAKLDYRLSNKFSFGLGAYHSKVCYQVDGKKYKADEGFWVDDIVPKEVLSECDILEVPLSLTWHPRGSDQSGLYLGGGLTSYFLLIEKFDFKYESPRTDLISTWREDDTNRHLFGMGQINFGYQRKTSRKSAFQVESFIQLPLTGIGQGKVNLLTVGASVNYTFDFRRKR